MVSHQLINVGGIKILRNVKLKFEVNFYFKTNLINGQEKRFLHDKRQDFFLTYQIGVSAYIYLNNEPELAHSAYMQKRMYNSALFLLLLLYRKKSGGLHS